MATSFAKAALQAAVLADDATGALETGALLAEACIAAKVTFDPELIPPAADAAVIDTETRHDSPSAARWRIERTACQFADLGTRHFYKKTDSTLRGNIAVEFDSLLRVFPDRALVYVPAYPRVGRTVAGGILLVDGVPVAETSFGKDPRDPVRESSIPRILGRVVSRPVFPVRVLPPRLDPGAIYVCDGHTDADLAAVAQSLEGKSAIVAGPGGFTPYWTKQLPIARGLKPEVPRARSLLVVCGSLHPISRQQAERARLSGVTVLSTPDTKCEGSDAARRLAETAGDFLGIKMPDAIIVFGGDTVFELLRVLGCKEAAPLGEILPGVPASTIAARGGRSTILITKAGGFGDEGIVAAIQKKLRMDS